MGQISMVTCDFAESVYLGSPDASTSRTSALRCGKVLLSKGVGMRLLQELIGRPIADDDANLADVPTMFGRAQVYEVLHDEGYLVRVLDIAGTWQSASYVDGRWADLVFVYHRVFDAVFDAPVPIRSALMLGGGALSFPKHVVACHDDVVVDVVEIDPLVKELAYTWFFLDRLSDQQQERLTVHVEDAMAAVRRAAGAQQRYDLIVNDLFAAAEPTAELMSEEGLRLMSAALAPQGIYVANVVSALKGRKKRPLHMVQEALESVFSQVCVVSLGADAPRVPDNNVVFATNGTYDLSEALSAVSA